MEEKLEELSQEKEEAVNTQNYEKAAKIRDLEKKIKEELEEEKSNWEKEKQGLIWYWYDDIAKVVSNWTGIPVSKMTTEESERLLNLEEILHEKVIGQNQYSRSCV